MIPDTCPYCGSPIYAGVAYPIYACRTTHYGIGEIITLQSPECARYVRTRISQLRRMAEYSRSLMVVRAYEFARSREGGLRYITPKRADAIRERAKRFRDACLRKIDRLKAAQS
jgi:hypothetical protein